MNNITEIIRNAILSLIRFKTLYKIYYKVAADVGTQTVVEYPICPIPTPTPEPSHCLNCCPSAIKISADEHEQFKLLGQFVERGSLFVKVAGLSGVSAVALGAYGAHSEYIIYL